jgi:hypothetical protein
MKVRHSKTPIPHCFRQHPAGADILVEADIGVTGRRAMQAKLLVFKTPAALRRFWRDGLGKADLGKGCLGAVTALACEVLIFEPGNRETTFLEVDPRYYCVIGLTVDNLNMEVVVHEAMHAGFAYAKRHARNFWVEDGPLDEESVCYPSGKIAAAINRFLHDKGLYR